MSKYTVMAIALIAALALNGYQWHRNSVLLDAYRSTAYVDCYAAETAKLGNYKVDGTDERWNRITRMCQREADAVVAMH
jgi:hypothetical protein